MRGAIALASVLALGLASAHAGTLPVRTGTCTTTRIKALAHRLEDGTTHKAIADSGSLVEFTNGGVLMSYDESGVVRGWRKGDMIMFCLALVPQNCPKGDDRGKIYTATNLRTYDSWTAMDSEHSCGGA